MLYIVNLAFDQYGVGEIIEAEPVLVADWVEARYISEVDADGERIVEVEPE